MRQRGRTRGLTAKPHQMPTQKCAITSIPQAELLWWSMSKGQMVASVESGPHLFGDNQ